MGAPGPAQSGIHRHTRIRTHARTHICTHTRTHTHTHVWHWSPWARTVQVWLDAPSPKRHRCSRCCRCSLGPKPARCRRRTIQGASMPDQMSPAPSTACLISGEMCCAEACAVPLTSSQRMAPATSSTAEAGAACTPPLTLACACLCLCVQRRSSMHMPGEVAQSPLSALDLQNQVAMGGARGIGVSPAVSGASYR